jgi:hypothetical protein
MVLYLINKPLVMVAVLIQNLLFCVYVGHKAFHLKIEADTIKNNIIRFSKAHQFIDRN